MATSDLTKEVGTAFEDEAAREYTNQYVTEFLATWRDVERGLARAVALLVLACVAAGLVVREDVSKLSVGFVEISDVDFLRLGLPVLIAYSIRRSSP